MSLTLMFHEINSLYSENVGIEIRTQDELYENERDLLQRAGLDRLAPIETWTALGTNMQLAYATHGIFRYFGKFPPPVATYLIHRYTGEEDLVIDPMSGSGTTAVESVLLERKCIVNDLNPLSYLLAKVKTKHIDEKVLRGKLEEIVGRYKPLGREEYDFVPLALKDPDHWFLPETSDSLRGIKYLVEQETNEELRDFLNVILAATVRRVSKATTQQGRLFLDTATALEDALPTFVKRFEIGINGMAMIPEKTDLQYYNCDLMELPAFGEEKGAGLVILHPPYFNSYRYSAVNRLETGWLGIDRTEYSRKEIREFFKVGRPENVTGYVEDMAAALTKALSMLAVGGRLALMIGDTVMKGSYIPVTRMLLDAVDLKHYSLETVALRVPKYTEATWVASQRRNSDRIGITLYDFMIVFRREK